MHVYKPDAAEPKNCRELILLFLASTAAKVTQHCFEERQRALQRFAAEYGELTLAEIKAFHLARWLDAHPSWKSDWQKKRIVGYVKRVWNWAEQLNLVDRNPFRGISVPNGEAGQPMRPEEYQALLRRATPDMRQILVFLRFTGCRPTELRAMRWQDVRWEQGVVLLTRHKTSRKTGRPRAIYLHPCCRKLLAWRHARRSAAGLMVFPGPNGEWNRYYLMQRFRRLRAQAGLPATLRLYGLRHLFGTQAILAGLDLKTVSELMGHTTTRMTEHYLHLAAHHRHFEAALQRIFGKNLPGP